MKKIVCAILVVTMLLSLAACATTPPPAVSPETAAGEKPQPAASAGKELNIAFFMFENSNTFTTYIRKGMEAYGKEKNVIVESFDGKSDQATQTDGIAAALAKDKYDLIVVNPVDSGAGATISAMCKEKGIPVIYADRAPDLVGGVLDQYDKSYYVGLDWSDPGAVQAQMVYEDWKKDQQKMDKNGDGILQYVLLQGNVAQQNAIFRCAAIRDLFEGWNQDGTMKTFELDNQDGNWSSDKGKDIMDTWNVKYGDKIEAVLVNNDTMAMGAIESLKTAGVFSGDKAPYVYGINGIPDVWELIEDGYMTGTVLTSPYREAMAIIDMSVNICNSKDPLDGTKLAWGEFKKDIRIDDVGIRLNNLGIAKEDFSACL